MTHVSSRRRFVFLLAAAVMSPGCGRSVRVEVAPPLLLADTSVVIPRGYAPRDTSLEAAVLRTIADSVVAPVRLNPKRLPRSLDAEGIPTTADMSANPDSGVARVRDLLEVVAPEGDSQRLAALCDKTGPPCPRERSVTVILGAARLGGPEMPKYAKPLEVKPTYWTVRVVSTDLGPRGGFTEVVDYVFEQTPTGWVFVRRVGLFIID